MQIPPAQAEVATIFDGWICRWIHELNPLQGGNQCVWGSERVYASVCSVWHNPAAFPASLSRVYFGESCQPESQRVIANMISGFQINDACYVPPFRPPSPTAHHSSSCHSTFGCTHTSSLDSHKSHITNHFRFPRRMQTHNVTWRIFSAFASIMGQSFPSATTPVWQQQQAQCSATAAITITQTKHIQHTYVYEWDLLTMWD